MTGIIGLAAFFVVLGLSLVITRLATTALRMTGLSWDVAHFQARSAFTGTGFTTKEAENVVDHPVRRRIISLLMIVRSAGLITIIISLILSFAEQGAEFSRLYRLLGLIAGVAVLWFVTRSKYLEKPLQRIMEKALRRWTTLDIRNFTELLKLSGKYHVTVFSVQEGDWLAEKHVRDCRLADEGVTILGIHRDDGSYLGVPRADTEIYPGDSLVLYGREKTLRNLVQRRDDWRGEQSHEEAVSEEQQRKAKEQSEEQKRKARKQKEKTPS